MKLGVTQFKRRCRAKAGFRDDSPRSERDGYALILVLIVLLALFALAAPFLLSVRRADQAGAQRVDRSSLTLAMDNATRHARAILRQTHPAWDATPDWDDADEFRYQGEWDREFFDNRNAKGPMWDARIEDLSGRIDLGSAPPQVLANLLGGATWLSSPVTNESGEFEVARAAGFDDAGLLWIEGEISAYGKRADTAFASLARGLALGVGATPGSAGQGSNPDCGPSPAANHGIGAPVMDFRAWALPQWRIAAPGGELREPRAIEEVWKALESSPSGLPSNSSFAALERCSTMVGDGGARARWQRECRILTPLEGGIDCTLVAQEARWFNPGTTVWLSDGEVGEFALVERVFGGGQVRLTAPVFYDYNLRTARVRPLLRRAVNVNTAESEVLVALFSGLKLRARNSRITPTEARRLAELVELARPLDGFESFVRDVVLPSAGLESQDQSARVSARLADAPRGFLDRDDAEALYLNALNANDARLEFSTMPFCFTAAGSFGLEVRAAVNAPSGVERSSGGRRQVEWVVPQNDLLQVLARQADFDEALRLTRSAAFWTTGPAATSRFEASAPALPPSRYKAHLGGGLEQFESNQLPLTFASRDEDGWAQLWPSRVDEELFDSHERNVMHFDLESRDPEGRWLPDEPLFRPTEDPEVEWRPGLGDSMLNPFSLSFWVRPRGLQQGDILFDVGGAARETDRVSLEVDGTDLVLRAIDGAADQTGTAGFEEFAEARLPLEFLPSDTWSHLYLDVRGNRPDQIELLVDGHRRGSVRGRTELTAGINESSTSIPVESTEGFPSRCTVRIGAELLEVEVNGPKSFTAFHNSSGELAGFGGRVARQQFKLTALGQAANSVSGPGLNQGAAMNRNHPAGSDVTLYGYSTPLRTTVPGGSSSLPGSLGPFAVAVGIGVEGGQTTAGDPIRMLTGSGFFFTLGFGLEGDSQVTGIELARGDDPGGGDTTFLDAFSPNGGYALLIQAEQQFVSATVSNPVTELGTPSGGIEVIRYGSRNGSVLSIQARGNVAQQELLELTGYSRPYFGGNRAFVTELNFAVVSNAAQIESDLKHRLFVVPISIPAPGVTSNPLGFISGTSSSDAEYAQLTRTGGEVEQTEWVRYDEVAQGHLVRDDPLALDRLWNLLTDRPVINFNQTPPEGGEGGDPPIGPGGPDSPIGPAGPNAPIGIARKDLLASYGAGGGAPSEGASRDSATPAANPSDATQSSAATTISSATAAVSTAAAAPSPQGSNAGVWFPTLGVEEDLQWPLTRAVRTAFQFRGVLGTASHSHPANTLILPVFRVWSNQYNPDNANPGRLDSVTFLGEDPRDLGFEGEVHFTARPFDYLITGWQSAANMPVAEVDTSTFDFGYFYDHPTGGVNEDPAAEDVTFVALSQRASLPLPPSNVNDPRLADPDVRKLARMVSFPSGELPRVASSLAVGGLRSGGGAVPAALVDELEFGSTRFGDNSLGGPEGLGAAMVLLNAVDTQDAQITVMPDAIRTAMGNRFALQSALDELPPNGGLLALGSEIVAYQSVNSSNGVIQLAADGRGLLGTEPKPHRESEAVCFLSAWRSAILATPLGNEDGEIEVLDLSGFPQQGTLLIGTELVHYTSKSSAAGAGSFQMPRQASAPGARDGRGPGIFRGRYGTGAGQHLQGSAVILMPFRYWDRWQKEADVPELAYFGIELEEPAALWRGVLFQSQNAAQPGVQLGMLVRTDRNVPWDADPDTTDGLWLFGQGAEEEEALSVLSQSDLLEARFFARYGAGATDFNSGLAHGWKDTPRLVLFAADYLAPGIVFERREL